VNDWLNGQDCYIANIYGAGLPGRIVSDWAVPVLAGLRHADLHDEVAMHYRRLSTRDLVEAPSGG
jgi:hypothetical protein